LYDKSTCQEIEWEMYARDHQTEDHRYEPEGINLDSDETNTHGELDGDTYWVFKHKELKYRTQDEEHEPHQLEYKLK
jgi:hypothetical protein